jgi:hypothetical protein
MLANYSMKTMTHKFVEFIPKELEENVMYVSLEYATVVHKCCCGCGSEVVTPLSPTDWKLTYDGETVSLDPSIGNWNFPCQSHYWIQNNQVHWAKKMSKKQIKAGQEYDRILKTRFYTKDKHQLEKVPEPIVERGSAKTIEDQSSLWSRLKKWWS